MAPRPAPLRLRNRNGGVTLRQRSGAEPSRLRRALSADPSGPLPEIQNVPALFEPLPLRGVTVPNRVAVAPMCQYSCRDGMATDWHLVHLGARAVGGAGLVLSEATAVVAEGRISPQDLGIWSDAHAAALEPVTRFIAQAGAVPGIQLAHAGRKASTYRPWETTQGEVPAAEGGWQTVGPSAVPFAANYPMPAALSEEGIEAVIAAFATAAVRAVGVGFEVLELHAAHGYLLHEFLSPLSNRRTDRWGGEFANRIRLVVAAADRIRSLVPDRVPLLVRISATDYADGGWSLEESVELARVLRGHGVDLIDTSSGGNVTGVRIPLGPGYQVAFAERIRREAGIATGAVGLITQAAQADQIVRSGQADLVLLARELLRDPHWPVRAARELGVEVPWPAQYLRAAPAGSKARPPRR